MKEGLKKDSPGKSQQEKKEPFINKDAKADTPFIASSLPSKSAESSKQKGKTKDRGGNLFKDPGPNFVLAFSYTITGPNREKLCEIVVSSTSGPDTKCGGELLKTPFCRFTEIRLQELRFWYVTSDKDTVPFSNLSLGVSADFITEGSNKKYNIFNEIDSKPKFLKKEMFAPDYSGWMIVPAFNDKIPKSISITENGRLYIQISIVDVADLKNKAEDYFFFDFDLGPCL